MKQIEINMDCGFVKDLQSPENNNRNYNLGLWNLNLSIRDLQLYSKGIKPNRHWTLKSVKEYFGIDGDKYAVKEKLELLDKICIGEV